MYYFQQTYSVDIPIGLTPLFRKALTPLDVENIPEV